MRKATIVLLMLALPVLYGLNTPAGASDPGDSVTTCAPTPTPEPAAAEDCAPDSVPAGWTQSSSGQPANQTCNVDDSIVRKTNGAPTVWAHVEVDCNYIATHLSVSDKIFWTQCNQHDGVKCPLNWNIYPDNPSDSGDPCTCNFATAHVEMNGRRGSVKYYWAHTYARRDGVDPFSHWEGPFLILVP